MHTEAAENVKVLRGYGCNMGSEFKLKTPIVTNLSSCDVFIAVKMLGSAQCTLTGEKTPSKYETDDPQYHSAKIMTC